MLDATTVASNPNVFRATDPAQVIYRSLLAIFTNDELARLEDEIGSIGYTGLLPDSVRTLLDAVDPQTA